MIRQLINVIQGRGWGWTAFVKLYLKENPECKACGTPKNLQVHHVLPIHTSEGKAREFDRLNVMTLCKRCHYTFGHLYNWKGSNPNVREDAAYFRRRFGQKT